MSNLSGSCKVGFGEGQSVDQREQERRARLLLLDGIREPSPQPIFGEPVKVELEDETSRRIKNTLGDVTQVLVNDPKSLIGISRPNPSSGYSTNGYQVPGHSSSSHQMSGHTSNSHPMSGHQSNSHPMSGHISSSHPMSGHIPNSHPMPGHISSSHSMSGHSNSHPMAGHSSSSHPMSGHPSNSLPMQGHTSNNHQLSIHLSNNHTMSSHSANSHSMSGHPMNNHPMATHTSSNHPIPGHPVSGHPSNHPITGHTINGHPSSGYSMAGHPVNVHPISVHPSNGHPLSNYSAAGYTGAGHLNAPSRQQQPTSKKIQLPANNTSMIKQPTQSMPNMYSKVGPDKRNSYNRHKPESPVATTTKPFHTPTFNAAANTQQQLQYQTQDNRSWSNEQKRSCNAPPVNINFSGGTYNNVTINNINVNNTTTSTCAPIWSCGPETPAINLNPFHLPACATPLTANKHLYNMPGHSVSQLQKFESTINTPAQKRPIVRPSHLKIPDHKPTSPIGVETILKEMTKPVPAPLTAIQTPRTEETGFAFPPEPKEELPFVKADEEKANPSNPPQEQKPTDVCQPSPMPYTSSLQDDLAMSESDEEVVPEKKENPTDYLKSPSSNPSIANSNPTPDVTTNTTSNMETNSASSSSSESGDSDSDDDSSESNNSDSSSDSSDEDTSSMKWGLSNFVDESRRNHSPALRNLEIQKKLNNANKANTAVLKDILSPPVSQPLQDLIVPDTPITTRSEILSPIRSPAHTTVGPRTPPSPACATKSDSEGNEVNQDGVDVKPENSSVDLISNNITDPPKENVSSGISEASGESKEKSVTDSITEGIISDSTAMIQSSVDESVEKKETPETSAEKENTVVETKSSSPSTDVIEENYPIKTRQKGVISAKKSKTTNVKKSSDGNQNTDDTSSPPIAKFKHPRACRKSSEKSVTPAKPEPVKEPKKRTKLSVKTKDVVNQENKIIQKPISSTKKPAKANLKQKAKANATKMSPKQNVEAKKGEIKGKNKNKKFVVENFLQSPTFVPNANLPDSTITESSSPEKLTLPENKKPADATIPPSTSTNVISKKVVKNNSKTTNKSKNEKLRRSARCSERASSLTQSESAETSKPSSEKTKKLIKKPLKSKTHVENLPISIEPSLQILSPIPHDSPIPSSVSEFGNQKIMVCIPLNKLLRIPSILHQIQEPDNRVPSKNRPTNSSEEVKQKKDATSEKPLKSATSKSSQSKDFKDKPRTAQSQKDSKNKNIPPSKKEASKPLSEISLKTSSNVNKNSTKDTDKTVCDVENKLPKKRKADGDTKQVSKKKPKLTIKSVEEKKSKDQTPVTKSDSSSPQNDGVNKIKPLERCDSSSSLSSLCSQRSSKSSKDKKDSSVIHESKRQKTSASTNPVKDVKQEKEDRPKLHIKKENTAPAEKIMKSREKSTPTDIDCKEKGELWNSLNNSSQYSLWDESCKEDSKEPLDGLMENSNMNWDYFSPEMHLDLKDASALKMFTDQGPIMPMDYYWTEGRKMKKLAEMEKDPFQQAVKFFEAAVLYVLTSQQKEETSKDPDSIYQFYYETLSFTTMMLGKIKKLQSCPGSTEFKLLILCLKCQSLLNVKLYSLKSKELKEQVDGVSDFLRAHCSIQLDTPNPNLPSLHQSRISSLSTLSSPHSVIPPSPNSVSSQTSGYVSSEVNTPIIRNTVCVPQSVLDSIYCQHTQLRNLHNGHDLWEQADMYMTRSNLKEFFKEVAEQSEPLTLHSTIKELVSYMQKGIILVKNYLLKHSE